MCNASHAVGGKLCARNVFCLKRNALVCSIVVNLRGAHYVKGVSGGRVG